MKRVGTDDDGGTVESEGGADTDLLDIIPGRRWLRFDIHDCHGCMTYGRFNSTYRFPCILSLCSSMKKQTRE